MNVQVLSPLETGEEGDGYCNANRLTEPRYRNDKPVYVNDGALQENEEDGYLHLQPEPPSAAYTQMTSPTPTRSAPDNVTTSEYADYSRMSYGVDTTPPWYLTIILAFQHYIILLGAAVAVPLVVCEALCIAEDDYETKAKLVGTSFFICGIATLMQTMIGVRLPLVQGGALVYVIPAVAMLDTPQWKCKVNLTSQENVLEYMEMNNITEPIWKPRMRELQGAVMVSGLLEVLLGFSGIIGFMSRFIGPLTIAPTITLIGLALFKVVGAYSSTVWWLTLVTIILIIAFSQYTKNIRMPCCKFRKGHGFVRENIAVFRLFPVILAVSFSWILAAILIVTKVLHTGNSKAMNSLQIDFFNDAPWARLPYPGQWGMPTLTSTGVLGMFSAVLASMMESLGDYYACARIARIPAPPVHAINRGLTVEGISCILAGAFGFGSGITTYSENIGAIGITKVASRRVLQVTAVFMLIFGIFGKFGALFATIPEPITAGVFIIMFGMITAIGLSNLQFVDLNSTRNLFIIGFSLFFGLTLPPFISDENIKTGSVVADHIIIVLLKSSMFVGGLAGFVLDNTVSGTAEERGIYKWREENKWTETSAGNTATSSASGGLQLPTLNVIKTYDLPFFSRRINASEWTKYLPICQTFAEDICCSCCKRKDDADLLTTNMDVPQSRDESTHI